MRTKKHKNEKGVALLLSILALMLLSAVAVTMMYMSGTESAINANFKAEETEYFASRAGVQEVRDRMIPGAFPYSINAINVVGAAQVCPNPAQCLLPSTLPAPGNPNGVLYILQNGVTMADVTNFGVNANCPGSNQNGCMADDELCHDYTIAGMTATAANVRCTDLPGGAWFSTPLVPAVGSGYLSVAPYALDWKWTRVTLKANSSTAYCVDGTAPVAGVGPPVCTGGQAAAQVCWNGSYEAIAPIGLPAAPSNNSPCGNLAIYANPVYVVTSLAVSPSGARRLIQEEVAQSPGGSQPGGLYALGTGCAALQMGGGAKTYSFDSSTEPGGPTDPPSNVVNSGGSVGSNGNVSVGGGATVQGTTFTNQPATWGNCNAGNGVSGNGSYGTISNIPTYPAAYSPPIPPFPTNPVPPVGQVNYNADQPLAAGTYGDVNIKAIITLGQGATAANPAVYTMDSIAVSGGGQIVIAGPVVININFHGNGAAVNIGGQGFANNSAVAGNFTINYGGPGSVDIQGGAKAYAVVNAPNSNVKLSGNANFYGQVLGATIDDTSGVNFYWDTAANAHPLNTNPYFEISMRELSY